MSLWAWIAIAAGCFLLLSTLVAFAVAAALGSITSHINELHETEVWALAPPMRAAGGEKAKDAEPEEEEAPRVVRLR
jgi:hypothetical protein